MLPTAGFCGAALLALQAETARRPTTGVAFGERFPANLLKGSDLGRGPSTCGRLGPQSLAHYGCQTRVQRSLMKRNNLGWRSTSSASQIGKATMGFGMKDGRITRASTSVWVLDRGSPADRLVLVYTSLDAAGR
jgi:hypothetical protein